MTRALVTGGTGKLGAGVVGALREARLADPRGREPRRRSLPRRAGACARRAGGRRARRARRRRQRRVVRIRGQAVRGGDRGRGRRRARRDGQGQLLRHPGRGASPAAKRVAWSSCSRTWLRTSRGRLFAAHCAAKAGQAMLTRALARALAPEVRVCGVAPGPVAVEPGQEERRAAETALGRVGSPGRRRCGDPLSRRRPLRDRDDHRRRRRPSAPIRQASACVRRGHGNAAHDRPNRPRARADACHERREDRSRGADRR